MSNPGNALTSTGPISIDDMRQIPGMLPQEIAIFRAWYKENANFYTSVQFNVRVGKGVDPGPAYDQPSRDAAILNTKYRIDALLYQQSKPYIAEVKYRLQPLAIGQLLSYNVLWAEQNNGSYIPGLLCICVQASEDMLSVARFFGITVDVVQADFSNIKVLKQG